MTPEQEERLLAALESIADSLSRSSGPISDAERARAYRKRHPERARSGVSPAVRAAIIERDGLTCRLCGEPCSLADVEIDHILAVIDGGGDNPENLQVTHGSCNVRKGARRRMQRHREARAGLLRNHSAQQRNSGSRGEQVTSHGGVRGGEVLGLGSQRRLSPGCYVTPEGERESLLRNTGERYLYRTDLLDDELREIASMAGVQDIAGAWTKFTGHYADQWLNVPGRWQIWCAREAKIERRERDEKRYPRKAGGQERDVDAEQRELRRRNEEIDQIVEANFEKAQRAKGGG
jgi:5-methylcytosine-specific restriction endonuclease McrA